MDKLFCYNCKSWALLFFQDNQSDRHEDQLSVPKVTQWFTGQSHRHLLLSQRERFKITVCFDHDCFERMPDHSSCFPVVSACSQTVTFPTAHFCTYEEFKLNLTTAITCAKDFLMIYNSMSGWGLWPTAVWFTLVIVLLYTTLSCYLYLSWVVGHFIMKLLYSCYILLNK